jgi:hypothetical protein
LTGTSSPVLSPGASLSRSADRSPAQHRRPARNLSTTAREAIVTNVLPGINAIAVRGVASAADITGTMLTK